MKSPILFLRAFVVFVVSCSSVVSRAEERVRFLLTQRAYRSEPAVAPLDDKTFSDLELDVLFVHLARLAPSTGARDRIFHLLHHPFLDKQEIRNRQQAIEALATNDELFAHLEDLFNVKHKALKATDKRVIAHNQALFKFFKPGVLGGVARGVVSGVFLYNGTEALPNLVNEIVQNPSSLNIALNSFVVATFAAMSASITASGSEGRLPILLTYIRAAQARQALKLLEPLADLPAIREIVEVCESQKKCLRTANWLSTLYPMNRKAELASFAGGIPNIAAVPGHLYINRQESSILQFLSAMIELEVYFTFAKFYRAHRDVLIFPRLLDTETARLKIVDGEHPFHILNGQKSIPNSVEFDEVHGNHSFIITGPNAGGKTTFQQMYMTLALMAQMGLPVPAKEMELTPFHFYTNFTTNTGSVETGRSTFRAQADRVAEILSVSQEPRAALVAMDEILTGTSTREHQAIERATLRTFHEQEGVLTTLATHDRSLASFADEVPGVGNLHVTLVGNKVLPGVSHDYNAFEILEEAKIPARLIKYAEHYFEKSNQEVCARVLSGEEK